MRRFKVDFTDGRQDTVKAATYRVDGDWINFLDKDYEQILSVRGFNVAKVERK